MAARYGKAAQKSVERAMRKRKRGTLRSRTGKKVTRADQAIAGGKYQNARGAAYAKSLCEAARKSVERAVEKQRRGTLVSGRSGKKVKSVEQAIAIGLSEAEKRGTKMPRRGKTSS